MQSFVPTIVAVSLPLSALWASANTNNIHIANPDLRVHRAIPVGASDLASAKAYGSNKTDHSSIINSDTLIDDGSQCLTTPRKRGQYSPAEPDLEMQKLGNGVHIDRSYGVRSN